MNYTQPRPMEKGCTLIIGYDFSLRRKIPWGKIDGEIDKMLLRFTGLSLEKNSPLPKETAVKVVRRLKFIYELVSSWKKGYDQVVLLEPYPHLKTYSILI